MKFPGEPESIRADTEMEWKGVSSWTVSNDKIEISGSTWRVPTAGRGGREGHFWMKCPDAPQYRHKPVVRRRSRSARVSRLESSCMGSGTGEACE